MRKLTAKDSVVSAYAVGVALCNQLSISTQVPATVKVATLQPRRTRLARVVFVVRPAPEHASDVPLLQWLEVLCNLRRMPGPTTCWPRCSTSSKACPQPCVAAWLNWPAAQPRARAVLGAVLELQGDQQEAARCAPPLIRLLPTGSACVPQPCPTPRNGTSNDAAPPSGVGVSSAGHCPAPAVFRGLCREGLLGELGCYGRWRTRSAYSSTPFTRLPSEWAHSSHTSS